MTNKLRVLQFGRYFPPHIGGTENVMLDLFEGLNDMGIRTDVLCCNDNNTYQENFRGNAKIIRTKTLLKVGSIAISLQQIPVLRKIWKQYDVIHIHHPAPMANIALWLVNPKAKIIVYWHSDIVRQKILLFFFKPFQNWLLKKAGAVVATTPYYIKSSEALQKYPSKTLYIPLGISPLKINSKDHLATLRSKYFGKKVIFSLGRLVGYKGFKFLVDAARFLDDSYMILIGGDGPLKQDLTNQIEKNNLSKRVALLGRLSDEELPDYFCLCDLYCMSSVTKNEAFGLVIAEAMSLGKPVVATNIPGSGVPWLNEHQVSGINVEVENPQAIASAIKEILDDDEKKKSFSEGALNRYNKLLKKEMMIDLFVDQYNKIGKRKI